MGCNQYLRTMRNCKMDKIHESETINKINIFILVIPDLNLAK